MKFGQKFIFSSLLTLFCGVYGGEESTTLNIEVPAGEEAYLTEGFKVTTLVKKEDGKLNVSGLNYDMDFLDLQGGLVYADAATQWYITNSEGDFIDQPVTLGQGQAAGYALGMYTLKITTFDIDAMPGYSEVTNKIKVALLRKIGLGTTNFVLDETEKLCVHFFNIPSGAAIINSWGVPKKEIQLGSTLMASSALDIPRVSLIANGIITYISGLDNLGVDLNPTSTKYAVIIRKLIMQGYMLSTNNADTEIDLLSLTTAGGTLANADFVTLMGAEGHYPLLKKDIGTVNVIRDLSNSTIAITTRNGTLQLSDAGILPDAPVDISTGTEDDEETTSVFQLSASTVPGVPMAGGVPGAMIIEKGCMLIVDANLTVPAEDSPADVFATGLQFLSGTTLKLGNGSVWGRRVNVGFDVPHEDA